MEQLLLYRYLDFRRKQSAQPGDKLKRIPFRIGALFVAVFVSTIFSPTALLSSWDRWIGIAAVLCEIVLAIVLAIEVERFCITNSHAHMQRYWEYCSQLKDALSEANIHSREDITEIRERLEKQIQSMHAERQASNTFYGKIAEIFAIPVILSIITTCIGQRNDIGEMVSLVISILLAAGMLFSLWLLIRSALRFPKKLRLEQMTEFCNDLQGVLDLERFGTAITAADSTQK